MPHLGRTASGHLALGPNGHLALGCGCCDTWWRLSSDCQYTDSQIVYVKESNLIAQTGAVYPYYRWTAIDRCMRTTLLDGTPPAGSNITDAADLINPSNSGCCNKYIVLRPDECVKASLIIANREDYESKISTYYSVYNGNKYRVNSNPSLLEGIPDGANHVDISLIDEYVTGDDVDKITPSDITVTFSGVTVGCGVVDAGGPCCPETYYSRFSGDINGAYQMASIASEPGCTFTIDSSSLGLQATFNESSINADFRIIVTINTIPSYTGWTYSSVIRAQMLPDSCPSFLYWHYQENTCYFNLFFNNNVNANNPANNDFVLCNCQTTCDGGRANNAGYGGTVTVEIS